MGLWPWDCHGNNQLLCDGYIYSKKTNLLKAPVKEKESLVSSDSDEESVSNTESSLSASISSSTVPPIENNCDEDTSEDMDENGEESDVTLKKKRVQCEFCLKEYASGGIKRHQVYCPIKNSKN